jgi:hypothetical protein
MSSTRASTAAGTDASKHQHFARPAASWQLFARPQSGQRDGSIVIRGPRARDACAWQRLIELAENSLLTADIRVSLRLR